MCLGQFPGQKKGIYWPKMDILPLKYVQIARRGLKIVCFCPALTKLSLDLHVNLDVCVYEWCALYFRSFSVTNF